MFRLLAFTFFALISTKSISQNYLDKIVEKSCECLDNTSETLDQNQFNMELGICMIEASMPYKKQLLKDHGIDMDHIELEGEKLGKLIGMKMVSVCPGSLTKIAQKTNGIDTSNNDPEIFEIEGTITKIETDFFVVFSIRDDDGKTSKFYWLTFIGADLESDYEYSLDKMASVRYEIQDFFDPKIGEYRQYYVIKEFAIMDE